MNVWTIVAKVSIPPTATAKNVPTPARHAPIVLPAAFHALCPICFQFRPKPAWLEAHAYLNAAYSNLWRVTRTAKILL